MRRKHGLREEHLLEKHRGMIVKLAWQYWKQLPSYTKTWVDPDDLVEDAYVYMLSRGQYKYDKRKSAESTFFWTAITNMYLIFASRQQTQKRMGWSTPLEDIKQLGKRDMGIVRVAAVDALLRCYRQASEECQHEMQRWFGFEKCKTKRSASAKRVYSEFRILAERNRLSPNDCRQIMRGGMWLG